jgi:hypothetical protein
VQQRINFTSRYQGNKASFYETLNFVKQKTAQIASNVAESCRTENMREKLAEAIQIL